MSEETLSIIWFIGYTVCVFFIFWGLRDAYQSGGEGVFASLFFMILMVFWPIIVPIMIIVWVFHEEGLRLTIKNFKNRGKSKNKPWLSE